ncbi:MAG TPA: hypothetical protein VHY84_02645 [Bryobacteraceae bacterium]|nr:hypothetical protein [Bryobacteraceae bacterium]
MSKKPAAAMVCLTRFFNEVVEARLPVHLWLDCSTLELYRTRL